jgi:hypothetical protein
VPVSKADSVADRMVVQSKSLFDSPKHADSDLLCPLSVSSLFLDLLGDRPPPNIGDY